MFYRAKATNAILFAPYVYAPTHRLNMELDLYLGSCVHLYLLAESENPHATTLLPPHLVSYTRALLVSQDRRHLFITTCSDCYSDMA
jgi:hypothetical protein